MCEFKDGFKPRRHENSRTTVAPNKTTIGCFARGAERQRLDDTGANAPEIMLQKINMEETLTEITVYPDTIW